jgi:hypothetical protein
MKEKLLKGQNNSIVQWDEFIAKNKKQTCLLLLRSLAIFFRVYEQFNFRR